MIGGFCAALRSAEQSRTSSLLLFLPWSGWWREIRQDWTGESSSRWFLQRTTPLISDFCFSDDSPTSCPLSSCISCVTARRGWIREVSEECLHYLICKGCSRLIIPSYNLSSPCSPPDFGGLNGGLVGLQALALPRSGRRLCVSTHRCLTCWPHFLFHSETGFSSQTEARDRNA